MAHNRIPALLGRAALPLPLRVSAPVLAAALVLGTGPAQASPSTSWRQVARISVRGANVFMVGVSALRPDDAWAFGEALSSKTVTPLIEQWDGIGWRQVPLPPRVRPSSAHVVWAAFDASHDGTLWALTFNGHYLRRQDGRWTTGLLPGKGLVEIVAVKVFSRNDVWAFGSLTDTNLTSFKPYAAHFDGNTWTVMPVPGATDISGMSAISPDDIYAVTGGLASAITGVPPRVLHWDGSTWRYLPVQPRFSGRAQLYAILAFSHSRVYIGGTVSNGLKTSFALVQRWNGTSWTDITPRPQPLGADEILFSFARAEQGGIWALSVDVSSNAAQVWHRAYGVWSAPVPLPWSLNTLTAIPHTGSTWASGTVKIRGQYRGVIVLHGPVPGQRS